MRVLLRTRIPSSEAHYAGELVDGARMLQLFGDAATELLIRHDGDEGLFRAYDDVQFLAPVRAGDYVEVEAEIVSVGNTSRKMRFEARTVISNVRDPGLAPSAADVLPSARVVCRATGTCVVPKDLQRSPSTASHPPPPGLARAGQAGGARRRLFDPDEIILTAAIVGAETTREQTPHLPITADEIAREAARCREAGASVIHLHVREPDGRPTQSAERFAEAIRKIREACDCIVQTSTGGAVGMRIEERAQPLLCRPEMATLNCGTVNFGDDIFENSRPMMREMAERIRAAGAVPELEIYEVGHLDAARWLLSEQLIDEPMHVQFVLGVPGAIGARESVLRFLVSELPDHATWGVAGVGRHELPMAELAVALGGFVRVGLEDNIYLSKGVLAEGSAPLVAKAAELARARGRRPVEPARAREILGIRASS